MVLLTLSLLSVEGGGNCSREEGLFQERKAMKRKLGAAEPPAWRLIGRGNKPFCPICILWRWVCQFSLALVFPNKHSGARRNCRWRDGSVVKGTCCSYQGSKFSSEHPYSVSYCKLQFHGIACPLLASMGTWYTHGVQKHAGKTPAHLKEHRNFKKLL